MVGGCISSSIYKRYFLLCECMKAKMQFKSETEWKPRNTSKHQAKLFLAEHHLRCCLQLICHQREYTAWWEQCSHILGNWIRNFVASPASFFLFLKRGYLWLCMWTHCHFQTINSFYFRYGSNYLLSFCLRLLCLLISFLSPSILHSRHRHANAFGISDGEEGASQWICGWWNRNPSGCWQTHFSGFSFIPTLLLVLVAKPLCDCAPRVWEHGNQWWQKRKAQTVPSLEVISQVINFNLKN